MKVKICEGCFQRCDIIHGSVEIDYAGTHCTYGRSGTHIDYDEASDCCQEEVREIDSDLLEWHEDLSRAAKEAGQEWMIYSDPERHYEGFDAGLDIEEELAKAVDVWSST